LLHHPQATMVCARSEENPCSYLHMGNVNVDLNRGGCASLVVRSGQNGGRWLSFVVGPGPHRKVVAVAWWKVSAPPLCF
jgi:hypothetical protein